MSGTFLTLFQPPRCLSSDHDPLFLCHRWQANLRILEVAEITTVLYVPLSHPFVERLIGTIRRECLDHTPFWNASDLESKLTDFKAYYNQFRVHSSLGGQTPAEAGGGPPAVPLALSRYHWRALCRGLYQLPVAA